MTLRPLTLLLSFVLLAGAARAQETQRDEYLRVPVDVSLWHDISFGQVLLGGDTTRTVLHHLAFHLPLGTAGRLEGVSLGLFGSAYRDDVWGLQLSGLGNAAGGNVGGLQLAGLGNVAGGRLYGFQIAGLGNVAGEGGGLLQVAGLGNIAGESFVGLQASGLGNITGESFSGVQAAGFGNIAGEEVLGLQAGGFGNIAGEGFRGMQIGGIGNIAGEHFAGLQVAGLGNLSGEGLVGIQAAGLANIAGGGGTGLQAAGLVNITGDGVRGLQVAGLANITGGVARGAQIGAVNIAETSAGLQLGLVNVAGEQRGIPIGLYSRVGGVPVYLDAWADETAALLLSVRSGSARITNYVGVGARPFGPAAMRWDVHAGLGVVQPLGTTGTWGVEAMAHSLIAENFGAGNGGLFRVRVPLAVALRPGLSVFGGPSVSLLVSDHADAERLAPFTLFEPGTSVRGWAGAFVGLRIRTTEGRAWPALGRRQ